MFLLALLARRLRASRTFSFAVRYFSLVAILTPCSARPNRKAYAQSVNSRNPVQCKIPESSRSLCSTVIKITSPLLMVTTSAFPETVIPVFPSILKEFWSSVYTVKPSASSSSLPLCNSSLCSAVHFAVSKSLDGLSYL